MNHKPTLAGLDSTWRRAETVFRVNCSGDCVHMDDIELEIVRFVSPAMLTRCTEDSSQDSNGSPLSSWLNFLQLPLKSTNSRAYELGLTYVLNAPVHLYRFLHVILPLEIYPYLLTFKDVRANFGCDPSNLRRQLHRTARCSVGWVMHPPASFFNQSMSLIPLCLS
jgi:hypothetical protein